MNDLVRVLRGQRIDGRGADEIMRRAADEIERLQDQNSSLLATNYDLRKERDRMTDFLEEARWLLSNAIANCDLTGYEGAAAWSDRRDAFLAWERK